MNTYHKSLYAAYFYLYYIFYFPISMSVSILLEGFLLYTPAVVFGLCFILFLSQFLYDYHTFYEFHSIEIKGPILMLSVVIMTITCSVLQLFFSRPVYALIVFTLFNVVYFFIVKYEYSRVKDGIKRLKMIFLFEPDDNWAKKKKQIIAVYTIITVYQVAVFLIFLIFGTHR